MTTITKERLLTIKQWRETYGPGSNVVLPAEEAEELARIALASLAAESVSVNDDMAYAFHHALSDSSLGADEVEEIKTGLRAAFANVTIQPEPVVPDEIALAIENLKQKLVECNRYNYCADAVKGVEDACRAVSYSQADNQPASGNQAAESNRGNEWTGNPDIDNAIIMLDRIDTLENCDDDRIEAVKAVLRRLAGNYPVTPDGWISCSERMPDTKTAVLVAVEFDRKGDWRMKWATYIPGHPDANDGWIIPGASWKPSHWMPLPEPPQEAK
ncbi:TPA: DUF551 domain-containing protein [Escherichia coli]|nr:DUF551 domain-containing protein [Escherichia coli]HDY0748133.1 DUF551 domain-containing protein [Escherichia coli]HDY1554067.1 DUF551 domain-containing protein [Escherichia coli]HEG1834095.1 DUF551 domain-containing protein [Escherichia coli]